MNIDKWNDPIKITNQISVICLDDLAQAPGPHKQHWVNWIQQKVTTPRVIAVLSSSSHPCLWQAWFAQVEKKFETCVLCNNNLMQWQNCFDFSSPVNYVNFDKVQAMIENNGDLETMVDQRSLPDLSISEYGMLLALFTDFGDSWSRFYYEIKDPSWPDCYRAKHFLTLPDHVKEECRTVFGYGHHNE